MTTSGSLQVQSALTANIPPGASTDAEIVRHSVVNDISTHADDIVQKALEHSGLPLSLDDVTSQSAIRF